MKKVTRILSRDVSLGYAYFTKKGHPLANSQGKVYQHRYIASIKIGRWLKPNEIVHHKDGDRTNNEESNLVIFSSSRDHARIHKPKHKRLNTKCGVCGRKFRAIKTKDKQRQRKFCSPKCSQKDKRKFDISRNKLKKLVWKMPIVKIAKMFGVSDVLVHKRCKQLNIKKPPAGYWN